MVVLYFIYLSEIYKMGLEWRAFYKSSPLPEVGRVEKRTDKYFIGLGINKGLKARGGSRMELKTCTSRDGELETWKKTYATDDIDIKKLRHVEVQKRRFYKTLGTVSDVEIVNIMVNKTRWVSVCVEGSDVAAASSKVKNTIPTTAFIGGYPAWLESLDVTEGN